MSVKESSDTSISTEDSSPIKTKLSLAEDLPKIIAHILEETIYDNEKNDKLQESKIEENDETKMQKTQKSNKSNHLDKFTGEKIPKITLFNFLKRIIKYTNPEKSTLVICLIYLDRFHDLTCLSLNFHNIHRLLLMSALIAIKYNEDEHCTNSYFAKVGGIPDEDLNNLEEVYLKAIRYNLYINDEEYEKYETYLNKFYIFKM